MRWPTLVLQEINSTAISLAPGRWGGGGNNQLNSPFRGGGGVTNGTDFCQHFAGLLGPPDVTVSPGDIIARGFICPSYSSPPTPLATVHSSPVNHNSSLMSASTTNCDTTVGPLAFFRLHPSINNPTSASPANTRERVLGGR